MPTTLADNPYRDSSVFEPESRIDYVFARPGLRRGLRILSVERVFDEALEFEQEPGAYSDHAGVLAEFALEGDRVAILKTNGRLFAKDGALTDPWTWLANGVADFQLT